MPIRLYAEIERWPLITPFRITGYIWEAIDVLVVRLETDGVSARGEASGMFYKNETPALMLEQLALLRARIESGLTRTLLQNVMPPNGLRNALDCALWDLEAKLSGRAAWQIAGLTKPRPLLTTLTCSADEPEKMAAQARSFTSARAIKLKLTGDPVDADRVLAVREARGDVWLGIDANQGFSRRSLEDLMPVLIDTRVQLIEQPFPVGQDAMLDGFQSPIPLAADESAQTLEDVPELVGRFNVVNIKLDKCGGLTEALQMARAVADMGLGCMIGNTLGTSLAMAPAFLVGQLCAIVDLDGPLLLKSDRAPSLRFADGMIDFPESSWGYGLSR